MDFVSLLISFAWVAVFTAILAVTGRRMARRELPPNQTTGIRVQRTLENADIWYAVHEKAGGPFVALALLGGAAFTLTVVLWSLQAAFWVWGGVLVLGVVLISWWSLSTTP